MEAYLSTVLCVVHLEQPPQPEGIVAGIPNLASKALFHVLHHVIQALAAPIPHG